MKFCSKCGKEINDEAVVCVHCGCQVENKPAANNDTGSFGWGFLGFCIPVVGLILYLVWKNTAPNNAKMAGKGALISVIVSVVFYIIYFAIIAGMLATL